MKLIRPPGSTDFHARFCPSMRTMEDGNQSSGGDADFQEYLAITGYRHPIRCGWKRLMLPVMGDWSPRAERAQQVSSTIHRPQTK